jgi:lysylphosphatidylglycerol synthetase-like protein (DUF2156 family)
MPHKSHTAKSRSSLNNWVRRLTALWVGLNGVALIMFSLARTVYSGHLEGLYLAGNTAWVLQYGVIVGVALLYISRHLAHGERRAQQVFLVLVAGEIIKYTLIIPELWLVAIYIPTFAAVFLMRHSFDRGAAELPLRSRLFDVLIIAGGGGLALVVIGVIGWNIPAYHNIVRNAFEHYGDLVLSTNNFTRSHLRSSLAAHTLTVLMCALVGAVLWALFRPVSAKQPAGTAEEILQAQNLLQKYSRSSEDFFKVWPADKRYFWSAQRSGFIVFKVVGSTVFSLADPVARIAPQRQALLREFVAHCRSNGWSVCFLVVPDTSHDLYKQAGLDLVRVGASAVVPVETFVTKTARDKWWRWQRNKGLELGYQYELAVPPYSLLLLQELRQISDEWRHRDNRREWSFAMGYFDEFYLQQCRLHILRDAGGRAIAFVNELPVFNNLPQTTIDLVRFRPDAKHAMPYLLLHVLEQLHKEQRYDLFDLGFVPLAQVDNAAARLAKILGSKRFSATGLEQFKNKFDPAWQTNLVAYDGDLGDLALVALRLEKAMAVQE